MVQLYVHYGIWLNDGTRLFAGVFTTAPTTSIAEVWHQVRERCREAAHDGQGEPVGQPWLELHKRGAE